MSYEHLYSKYVDIESGKRAGDELLIRCPLHEDSNASMSVNLKLGVFKCFTPGCRAHSGGSAAQFIHLINGISLEEARKIVEQEHPTKKTSKKKFPYTIEDISAWYSNLCNNTEAYRTATEKFKWSVEILYKYQIGFDGKSFTVPVFEHDTLVNVRRYTPSGTPKVVGVTGFNTGRLWPFENLSGSKIYLMEGEKDCIRAMSLGLNAVTCTGGAGAFSTDWVKFFLGKDVVIVYDIDEAGRVGAAKVSTMLSKIANKTTDVLIPLKNPPNADFTDFMDKHTLEDFYALEQSSVEIIGGPPKQFTIPPDVTDMSMEDAIYTNSYYRRLRFRARVSSKYKMPFIVPCDIRIMCNVDQKYKCVTCTNCSGTQNFKINEERAEVLTLIECNDAAKKTAILKMAGVNCEKCNLEYLDSVHMEIVFVMPVIDEQDARQAMDTRVMYTLNSETRNNEEFVFHAILVHSPRTQNLVFIGYHTEPSESSIDSFVLTPEIIEELSAWKVSEENLDTYTLTSSIT